MSRLSPANPADAVPVKRLAFNPATGTHEARAPTAKFIRGPIPLEWISRANALPGKAGAVGLALWFLVGVQGSRTVKLTGEVERIAGCGRKAVYQALNALERTGLIICTRRPGARMLLQLSSVPPNFPLLY
ncbi:MAG: hypothetical protein Q8M20_17910 [Rhodocyclaceae bacterium]|nr:hypothetical protein [Rhodocyclaceae bacterium]MDZ4213737.1 hypothetical protein [Rhodocyclaceae bacterium]